MPRSAKTIEKKIETRVTDSGAEIRHDRDGKPGVSNLIEIYGAVTGNTVAAVEKEFDAKQYGVFKVAVAEAVVEYLRRACRIVMPNSRPTRPRSTAGSRSGPTPRKPWPNPCSLAASLAAGLLPRSR